jgi:phosphoserine phosphatase
MLSHDLQLHLATADTLGTAADLGGQLGLPAQTIHTGNDKPALVAAFGPDVTAAIGNGRNDVAMLRAARSGIGIVGPEAPRRARWLRRTWSVDRCSTPSTCSSMSACWSRRSGPEPVVGDRAIR